MAEFRDGNGVELGGLISFNEGEIVRLVGFETVLLLADGRAVDRNLLLPRVFD